VGSYMGEIIKNMDSVPNDGAYQDMKMWDVITKESDDTGREGRRQKIIKARDAVFSSIKKQVPSAGVGKDSPAVTVIEDRGVVTGLEIVCTCGEKIIVHFNFTDEQNG